MVMEVSWFGPVFVNLGLDSLPSLMEKLIKLKLYQEFLKENVRTPVTLPKIWVMQQDNDPEHTSHSTKK